MSKEEIEKFFSETVTLTVYNSMWFLMSTCLAKFFDEQGLEARFAKQIIPTFESEAEKIEWFRKMMELTSIYEEKEKQAETQ